MHNHQLLSNLINPALPARPVCIHVYVCASVCGTKRNGGVKWISDKSEGRDGQDGGGEGSPKSAIKVLEDSPQSPEEAAKLDKTMPQSPDPNVVGEGGAEDSVEKVNAVPHRRNFAAGIVPFEETPEFTEVAEATGTYLKIRDLLKGSPRSLAKKK